MNDEPTKLKLIMLDWAGTTIDHGSRAPAAVFLEIFRRSGVEISIAEARGPMGRAKRDHLATVLALPRVSAAWEVRFGKPPVEADVDRLYAEFLPLQEETLAQHCGVIAGVVEVVAECRRRGLKIGGSTGYTRALMNIVEPLALRGGYAPDVSFCADDAPAGRPAPWMIFRAAEAMNVYPMSTIVTVDDTPVGILAGLNAGTWTVAVTRTGNCVGVSEDELEVMDPRDLEAWLAREAEEFRRIGAHFVVESVADLIPVLEEIERRLNAGERP